MDNARYLYLIKIKYKIILYQNNKIFFVLGGPFGTVVTFTLCGQIISAFGWKAAYYITSGLILIFYALWVFLIYDTPDLHPGITENEKVFIKEQIGTSVSKQKVSINFYILSL